jgi:hypothetical protein
MTAALRVVSSSPQRLRGAAPPARSRPRLVVEAPPTPTPAQQEAARSEARREAARLEALYREFPQFRALGRWPTMDEYREAQALPTVREYVWAHRHELEMFRDFFPELEAMGILYRWPAGSDNFCIHLPKRSAR